MKVLIICVGSRGDAEPFVALAARVLQDTNNSVELFIQPELKTLAPTDENLTVHELPFTQFDFYKYTTNPSKGANDENERVRFVGIVAEVICALVLPCMESVLDVAKRCDIMVTSNLSRYLCFALSAKFGIPTVLVNLQALVPTKYFPHYAVDGCVEAIIHLMKGETSESEDHADTYWLFERKQLEFMQEELDDMYSKIGLTPLMDHETINRILLGNDSLIYIANALNEELIPVVSDAGPRVHQIGPLADHYIPSNFEPPTALIEFMSINPKPICIGFGSMPFGQVPLLIDALREVDRKAVFVGKDLELPVDSEWTKNNIIHVSSIPYAWLLPQCQMMICHGGAGVLSTTLRAGIPIIVSPFFGDQFFHAELCKARGVGARAGQSLPSATQADFVQAIGEATSCIEAARKFGEERRLKSHGVDNLVEVMGSIV